VNSKQHPNKKKFPEPKPCGGCQRVVAMRRHVNKMTGTGKARVRHKCSHGFWCSFGEMPNACHANWNWNCRKCVRDQKIRSGEWNASDPWAVEAGNAPDATE
jgi:hypothetical protein